ncbi:hypothetical protein [Chryseobacterium sp. A301]
MKKENYPQTYKDLLKDLKDDSLEWEFKDFIEEAQSAPKKELVVGNSRKRNSRPYFLVAASVTLLVALGVGYFMKSPSETKVQFADRQVKEAILSEKQSFELENQAQAKVEKKQESHSTLDSIGKNRQASNAEQEVLNTILPTRGRLKKHGKVRYVQNEPKEVKTSEPKKSSSGVKEEYQDNYVIINGQKIENEAEAIDITKYSLRILSDKVSQTVAKADATFENVEF